MDSHCTDIDYRIQTEEALLELYGHGSKAALVKEIDYIHPVYQKFIAASNFVIIASSGPVGMDASPRGDPAGFVAVENERRLLIPDRRGNNRVDTLHNIVGDPRVGLLFLIPGIAESLRVNGRAHISIEPALLQRFVLDGKLPRSVIVIDVETVYFQFPRASVRADFWNPEKHVPRTSLPSNGEILAALSGDREYLARDATREAVVKSTLY